MRVVFVGKTRVAWRGVLWYVLSLGIYRRVWLVRTLREMSGHQGLALGMRLAVALAVLPAVGPYVLSVRAHRMAVRIAVGSTVSVKASWAWPVLLAVPIAGPATFVGVQQGRLNRLWAYERGRKDAGFELDVDLSGEPRFLVEMGEAIRRSYDAASTTESGWLRRLRTWRARTRLRLRDVRRLRAAVRAAGGSTPVLPWRAPTAPAPRRLNITCGSCSTRFTSQTDGISETVLLCPSCGASEVLPGLVAEVRREKEKAAVVGLRVKCPDCKTRFQAVRNLAGATPLQCPKCGRAEALPAGRPAA